MIDIVERLRGCMTSGDQHGADSYNSDLEEEAQKIETLRAKLQEAEKEYNELHDTAETVHGELLNKNGEIIELERKLRREKNRNKKDKGDEM